MRCSYSGGFRGLGEKVDASRKGRPPPSKWNPGPAIDSALLQRGIAHWSLITARKRRQTPPPPEMATEAGGTHPTGMHSCFWVYPTTSDISSLSLVMSIMSRATGPIKGDRQTQTELN